MTDLQEKVNWSGKIKSIQVRATVWRYLTDNRTHRCTGYNIFLSGIINGCKRDYCVAISEKQQMKMQFSIGDEIQGTGWTKLYPKLEYADLYRAGGLKIIKKADPSVKNEAAPPWVDAPPDLDTFEWRGCRMLAKTSWSKKCFTCKWANMSNVTIEYNFGVSQKHRFESFCYGPLSCKYYKMGPARAVPYIHRNSAMDEGWLDEICVENRKDPDE